MGTFQGHALPGLFFIANSIWWIVNITRRQFICNQYSITYQSTATFRLIRKNYLNVSVEGWAKLVSCFVGMCLEMLAAFDYGREVYPVWLGDLQHFTMYLFFFLSGVVDVMKTKTKLIPHNADYVMLILGFLIEGYLFSFHLHGRNALDVTIHHMLVLVIWMCVGSLCLELACNQSCVCSYVRSYCVLLQGVLFIQVGFILYNPLPNRKPWLSTSHDVMLAMCVLLWNSIGVVFLLTAVSGATAHYMSTYRPTYLST